MEVRRLLVLEIGSFDQPSQVGLGLERLTPEGQQAVTDQAARMRTVLDLNMRHTGPVEEKALNRGQEEKSKGGRG